MSNRFMYRVKRLERRITAPGGCKECHGENRLKVIMEHDPVPDHCSRCGREWTVIRIIRGTPPEERDISKTSKEHLA